MRPVPVSDDPWGEQFASEPAFRRRLTRGTGQPRDLPHAAEAQVLGVGGLAAQEIADELLRIP